MARLALVERSVEQPPPLLLFVRALPAAESISAARRLEDQAILIQLLQPERIGITQYQIDPEQSAGAIIADHPAARYFVR